MADLVVTPRINQEPVAPLPTQPPSSLDQRIYYYAVLGKVFSALAIGTASLATYCFYYGMIFPYVVLTITTIALIALWQVCSEGEEMRSEAGTERASRENSLEAGEPVGLHNGGWLWGGSNDCFINATLQGILMDPELITALRATPLNRVQRGRQDAFQALLEFFDQHEQDVAAGRSVSEFSTNRLRGLIPARINNYEQADGHEFLTGIYNFLSKADSPELFFSTEIVHHYKEVSDDGLTEGQKAELAEARRKVSDDPAAQNHKKYDLMPLNGERVMGREEFEIPVYLRYLRDQEANIEDVLDAHFSLRCEDKEPVKFFHPTTGTLCFYKEIDQCYRLVSQPNRFTLKLNRFYGLEKIHTKVRVSEQINLKGQAYDLQWFVQHLGSAQGGHYVAYVKGADGAWWYISDSHKSKASSEQLQTALAAGYYYFFKKAASAAAEAQP